MEYNYGSGRYRLLEMVRQFAQAKLSESQDEQNLQTRFIDWGFQIAEDSCVGNVHPNHAKITEQLIDEQHNLRRILGFLLDLSKGEILEAENTLYFVALLQPLWEKLGQIAEAKQHFNRLFEQTESLECTQKRGFAFRALGNLVHTEGKLPSAEESLQMALHYFRQLNLPNEIAKTLSNLGSLACNQHELEKAGKYLTESLKMHQELGNSLEEAEDMGHLGYHAYQAKDFATSREFLTQAMTLYQNLGSHSGLAWCRGCLSNVAIEEGNFGEARQLLEMELQYAREQNSLATQAWIYNQLAYIANRGERYHEALPWLRQSLSIYTHLQFAGSIAWTQLILGRTHFYLQNYKTAQNLLEEASIVLKEVNPSQYLEAQEILEKMKV